jgi:hypothetical protein
MLAYTEKRESAEYVELRRACVGVVDDNQYRHKGKSVGLARRTIVQ